MIKLLEWRLVLPWCEEMVSVRVSTGSAAQVGPGLSLVCALASVALRATAALGAGIQFEGGVLHFGIENMLSV